MPSSPCIDFDLSGAGDSAAGPIALKDVQQTCVDLGFVKKDVADSKPLAQRANVADFFKALGVNSLSSFKARFYGEKLPQPYPGQAPLVAEKVRATAIRRSTLSPVFIGEYEKKNTCVLPHSTGNLASDRYTSSMV